MESFVEELDDLKRSTVVRRARGETGPAQREQNEIAVAIDRILRKDGIVSTRIPFLDLMRRSGPTVLMHGMLKPSFCYIAQGKKKICIGRDVILYGAGSFVISSVDMPASGQVVDASNTFPYLGLGVALDPEEVAGIHLEAKLPALDSQVCKRGAAVAQADAELRAALLRLMGLLQKPDDIPFLAPALKREIIYRLLMNPDARPLLDAAVFHPSKTGIQSAIVYLKQNFTSVVHVEKMAAEAGMSISVFHRRFKEVTTLSPIQYKKRLRLLEARRILLAGSVDTATAAFTVGYESATQFNREYRRLFGEPPGRDIARLQVGSR